MKSIFFLLCISCIFSFDTYAQALKLPEAKFLKTTKKLPAGLTVKKGILMPAQGYTATLNKEKNIVRISKSNNSGEGSIAITCYCATMIGNRACAVVLVDGGGYSCATCNSGKTCSVLVGTDAGTAALGNDVADDGEGHKMKWTIFELPKQWNG